MKTINNIDDARKHFEDTTSIIERIGYTEEIKDSLAFMIEFGIQIEAKIGAKIEEKNIDFVPVDFLNSVEGCFRGYTTGFFSQNELYLTYEKIYANDVCYSNEIIKVLEKEFLNLDERRTIGLAKGILRDSIFISNPNIIEFYRRADFYFSYLDNLLNIDDEGCKTINEIRDKIFLWKESKTRHVIGNIASDYGNFFSQFKVLCDDYGIDLINISKEIGCDVEPFLGEEDYCDCNSGLGRYKNQLSKTKISATTAQKWAMLQTLMNLATGWRLTDDENKLNYNKTDIAKFISYFCGGSEEVIRKKIEDDLPKKEITEMIPYLNSIGLQKVSEIIKKT